MKRIAGLILLLALVPQITEAAWWKPSSWRVFSRPAKTASTTPQMNNEIEALKKEIEELKKTQSQPAQTKSIIAQPVQTPVPVKTKQNNSALYEQLLEKYLSFKNQIRVDIETVRESVSLTKAQIDRIEQLNTYIEKINLNADELTKAQANSPNTDLNLYSSKLDRLVDDYNYDKKTYGQAVIRESIDKYAQECEDARTKYRTAISSVKKQARLDMERLCDY
jgi:hypothetical protein